MTSRLADRLRSETRTLHLHVERSAFMARLLRGQMDVAGYAALLRNLGALYAVLEEGLGRHAADPALSSIDFSALARSRSLAADLATLEPASIPLPADGSLQPSCIAYVARLRKLDASQPGLLLAHAYVRYLGDLSGGQLLRGIVARSPQLGAAVGVNFYEFGDASAVAQLSASFRNGLDQADVDDDAIVEEAKAAFVRHRTLFDELAVAAGGPA